MTTSQTDEQIVGRIFKIDRLSRHDGPGFRSTVFIKGCPLLCRWCHNPESQSATKELAYYPEKCIRCGQCIPTCPVEALSVSNGKIWVDRTKCYHCGKCAAICPTQALEMIGQDISVEEIITILMQDKAFYDNSGGGVTLSGGEPFYQPIFLKKLLSGLKKLGIHTAIDTSGYVEFDKILDVLPFTDLFLYDLKVIDNCQHHLLTGKYNDAILKNLHQLVTYIIENELPTKIWIRTPLIPGDTNNAINIEAIGSMISHMQQGPILRWELCAFNPLCEQKYKTLDWPWFYEKMDLMTNEELNRARDQAVASGVPSELVLVSGFTKKLKT